MKGERFGVGEGVYFDNIEEVKGFRLLFFIFCKKLVEIFIFEKEIWVFIGWDGVMSVAILGVLGKDLLV